MVRIFLTGLGWKKEDESIIKYINKNFNHIKKIIDNLKQSRGPNKGKVYSESTKKIFYQCISAGFSHSICPPFEQQMGQEAKQWWTQSFELYNAEDKVKRREQTFTDEDLQKNKDWETIQTKTKKYIDKKKQNKNDRFDLFYNNPLENMTITQIYTELGGVPRSKTFLNLNVVKTKAEATNKDTNYYVLNTKTLISNNHKTGVNEGKTKGKAIIIELKNDYKHIADNLDKLAKEKTNDLNVAKDKRFKQLSNPIIFYKQQTAASTFFTQLFGKTNNDARHAYTSWVYKQPRDEAEELIKRESYIQGHSIDTALSLYAKKVRR
jgi:hypothetical protein